MTTFFYFLRGLNKNWHERRTSAARAIWCMLAGWEPALSDLILALILFNLLSVKTLDYLSSTIFLIS
jgi:hypothetical protein